MDQVVDLTSAQMLLRLLIAALIGGVIGFERRAIDAENNTLSMDVSDVELQQRRAAWQAPAPKFTKGVLYKYMKTVSSASQGCVTDA